MPAIVADRPTEIHPNITIPSPAPVQETVLVTASAASLPEVALAQEQGARIVIVGDSPIAMSLAELTLPGALALWCNLRQSAEVHRLASDAEAAGPVTRLILAPASGEAADTLALMRVVLAFLPALRLRGRGLVDLIAPDATAAVTLASFVEGLRPGLNGSGVKIRLRAR